MAETRQVVINDRSDYGSVDKLHARLAEIDQELEKLQQEKQEKQQQLDSKLAQMGYSKNNGVAAKAKKGKKDGSRRTQEDIDKLVAQAALNLKASKQGKVGVTGAKLVELSGLGLDKDDFDQTVRPRLRKAKALSKKGKLKGAKWYW